MVEEYIKEEISHNRLISPLTKAAVPLAYTSRFRIYTTLNKWRLIADLYYPPGGSVNDGILKSLCSLSYVTLETVVQHILQMGPGALLTEMDIKHAFRLLPVHPADRHLLAMSWNGNLFIDTCLPFWLRSAPKLFNILADLLSWILEKKGTSPIIHYLDDLLTMDLADSLACHNHLNTLKEACQYL